MNEDRYLELRWIEFVIDLKCYFHSYFLFLNFKSIDIVFLRLVIVISFDNSEFNFLKSKSWMIIWKDRLYHLKRSITWSSSSESALISLILCQSIFLETFSAHCHIWSDINFITLEKVSYITEKVSHIIEKIGYITWKSQLYKALLLKALSSALFFIKALFLRHSVHVIISEMISTSSHIEKVSYIIEKIDYITWKDQLYKAHSLILYLQGFIHSSCEILCILSYLKWYQISFLSSIDIADWR